MNLALNNFPKLSLFFKELRTQYEGNQTPMRAESCSIDKISGDRKLNHPFSEANGMRVLHAAPGYIRAEIDTNDNGKIPKLNSYGTIHGGFTTTMSDAAMAAAANTLAKPNQLAVSSEIYNKFYRPVSPGEKLELEAFDLHPEITEEKLRQVVAVTKSADSGEIVSASGAKFYLQAA